MTTSLVHKPTWRTRMLALVWRSQRLRLVAARAMFQSVPHGRALGMHVTRCDDEGVEAVLPYQAAIIGDPTLEHIHPGPLTVLIDQVSGAAACLATRPPSLVATLDLRLDFLRPTRPGREIRAYASAYRVTRQIVFVHCVAHDGDPDRPVAIGSSSFMRNGVLEAGPVEMLTRALRAMRRR